MLALWSTITVLFMTVFLFNNGNIYYLADEVRVSNKISYLIGLQTLLVSLSPYRICIKCCSGEFSIVFF